jgi:hypothetical protein
VRFADILSIINYPSELDRGEVRGEWEAGPAQAKPKSVGLMAPQARQLWGNELQFPEHLCAVYSLVHSTNDFDPLRLEHV